jgi:hypothetical protein
METDIIGEKRLKGGNRANKIKLIERENPNGTDCFTTFAMTVAIPNDGTKRSLRAERSGARQS